jgi:hypothetical protein
VSIRKRLHQLSTSICLLCKPRLYSQTLLSRIRLVQQHFYVRHVSLLARARDLPSSCVFLHPSPV